MEHIAETLESVLQQDYPFLEYIVVDGGSTDGTMDIVRAYQVRSDFAHRIELVISEPDQGMYDAVAKGFDRATGDIYCYLNADDLFECGGLRSVGEYFALNPQADVIYHEDTVLVDGWKFPNVRQPDGIGTIDLLHVHILFQDGVFWRRAAYSAVGGIRRDLRLAGDFDLWLRLSMHFTFVRRPEHVSCFRVRPGQLSSATDRYLGEMNQSIADIRASASLLRRALWELKWTLLRARRNVTSKWPRDRLFFPIDFANLPPPACTIPEGLTTLPRSPIDGEPAERLLFSSLDTRFGGDEVHYIYLDERHGIAITHPKVTAKKLDALYQKNYSFPSSTIKLAGATSPYKNFNRQRLWEKALVRLPVGFLARIFYPSAWLDNTLRELIKVLKESGVDTSKKLRFLDTGCFEGQLLDQIRNATCWEHSGLEPNSLAAEVAKDKGHQVWCGHAENADTVIPQEKKFDIIYLGQSIEHVDDPANVLGQLKLLLADQGVIVVSTPNLDSREVDWFGPTWAHWHPPYHRHIFSKKGLYSLANKVDLLPVCFMTFSHPYWTSMSLAHNALGLGGSASHAVDFPPAVTKKAQIINFWKDVFWNRLGRGDYSFLVMKEYVSGYK
jgi:glycosyltransferase involved in cell wall biosynthesis/2-polyprenyl-3-methyl-5-hydroxy-6-metoxy-1,4-benzoquinol methylase